MSFLPLESSSRTRKCASSPPSLARAATLDAEDRDLRGRNWNRPKRRYEAGRHRDFLRAVRRIGDDAAGDRAVNLLTPKLLAVGGVNRIEVSADVAKEHEASGGRRHAGQDRIIGPQPPFPDAGVGVDGMEPSAPISVRARLLPELIERIERRLPEPRLSRSRREDFLPGLHI